MAFLASSIAASAAPAPVLDAAARDLAHSGELAGTDCVLRFFPVHDFQRQTVAALFCTPMCASAGAGAVYGHGAFHDFTRRELAMLDCAILRHALDFAGRLSDSGVTVAVGASVAFATLSDPNGRILYRETLRAAQARQQAALVIKIEDIPAVTGARRIAEIVSCIRPQASRIWVHLPGSHVPLGGHEQLHAAGVVLSMPARLPAHGMQTEARWLARVAALQTALACMDHVDTAAELEAVRGAGIRFVAGHAVNSPALAASASLDDIRAALYGAPLT